jgi:hypothetical protein
MIDRALESCQRLSLTPRYISIDREFLKANSVSNVGTLTTMREKLGVVFRSMRVWLYSFFTNSTNRDCKLFSIPLWNQPQFLRTNGIRIGLALSLLKRVFISWDHQPNWSAKEALTPNCWPRPSYMNLINQEMKWLKNRVWNELVREFYI